MAGNTFGTLFRITTFGESHGPALGVIIDGCPANIALSVEDIQPTLDHRKPGTSAMVSQRQESDTVEILSGVYEGKTLGTPIHLLIRNEDARSSDYQAFTQVFRPGHADIAYFHKYGIYDHRGGGRASARETVARVAAGAVANKILRDQHGIMIHSFLSQVGEITIAPGEDTSAAIAAYLDDIRNEKDSIGAKISVLADNVPRGLGEPVFDKLSADIAKAMMSIPAAKAVAIGDGFDCVTMRGSQYRDLITKDSFLSNHAGGILGGISTGQQIVTHIAFKPTSSIAQTVPTVNTTGESVMIRVTGRHDPCVGIRAAPICKAMMALVLIDLLLRHKNS